MKITDENLVLFAAKNYDKISNSSMADFIKDLEIPVYLKRLFGRYLTSGELRERLILNHMIIFYNVFGQDAATKILFFKLDEKFHSILKSFLIFLNRCPDFIEEADLSVISLDFKVLNILRKI